MTKKKNLLYKFLQKRNPFAWHTLALLTFCLFFSGCGGHQELISLADEVQSIFGGEPFEVKRLREEPVETTDGIHLEYYFRQLSAEEQQVYRQPSYFKASSMIACTVSSSNCATVRYCDTTST